MQQAQAESLSLVLLGGWTRGAEQAAKPPKRETSLVFLRDQRALSKFAVTHKLELTELKPGILRTCLQGQEKLWICLIIPLLKEFIFLGFITVKFAFFLNLKAFSASLGSSL